MNIVTTHDRASLISLQIESIILPLQPASHLRLDQIRVAVQFPMIFGGAKSPVPASLIVNPNDATLT